jgi:hypothetical protein
MKMEAMQPSGSFKMRGVGHACEYYAAQGRSVLSHLLAVMRGWQWLMPGENWAFLPSSLCLKRRLNAPAICWG